MERVKKARESYYHGFTCEYDGGDMHLQEDELADARWFARGECPITPPPGSIAYRLINNV